MPINIEMPKLSDTMTEGTVVRWLKKEGDEIEIGDIIAEIETDKATMEMEAFDEGTLSQISVAEGGKAPVGSVIAVLLEDGEEAGESSAAAPEAAKAEAAPAPKKDSIPIPPSISNALATAAASLKSGVAAVGERIKASPLAKKIAEVEGIDLSAILGTGPGGRIVKADLEGGAKAAPAPTAATPAPAAKPAPVAISPVASGEDKIIALSGMRKIIAERLLTSRQPSLTSTFTSKWMPRRSWLSASKLMPRPKSPTVTNTRSTISSSKLSSTPRLRSRKPMLPSMVTTSCSSPTWASRSPSPSRTDS